MGISRDDIKAKGFQPNSGNTPNLSGAFVGGATAQTVRDQAQDTAREQREDMARIIAEGDGFLNPQELRNLAVRLAKMETEEELRMALSGVLSGRMMTFFFQHLHDTQAKATEQQRKNRADMFYLALLQAQIDQLNEEIAVLDERITEFEDRHFTDEERAYFATLSEEDRFAAKDKAMRDKLANGEITQAEYDQWKTWNEQRAAKMQDRDRVEDRVTKVANQTDAQRILETETAATAEAAAQRVGGAQARLVEAVTETKDDSGNIAKDNNFDDLLAGLDSKEASTTPDNQQSFAAQTLPDAAFSNKLPAIREQFDIAAEQTTQPQAAIRISLNTDRENGPIPTPPAVG